jgi:hypothetical protein
MEPPLDDIHAVPDATLGGYIAEHNRPPAFEGVDGMPYTVSIEAERHGSLRQPWAGYLVFPRWADTGLGIVGHVETDVIANGRTEDEIRAMLGNLSLDRVKSLLDDAIRARVEAPENEANRGAVE